MSFNNKIYTITKNGVFDITVGQNGNKVSKYLKKSTLETGEGLFNGFEIIDPPCALTYEEGQEVDGVLQ